MAATHSPEFIAEMKVKLTSEAEILRAEIATLTEGTGAGAHTKFPEYGRHEEENANEVADWAALAATAEAGQERLKAVEEALERIQAGTYGVTASGEVIPENRLRANPAATTLVT